MRRFCRRKGLFRYLR